MTLEMQIVEAGNKPVKLAGDGKKKIGHVTIATAVMVIDDESYKVQIKVTGPDADGAVDLFGTVKLGDAINIDCSPESPE